MIPIKIDISSWIPDSFKQQLIDTAVDFLTEQAKKALGDQSSELISKLKSDSAFHKEFDAGLLRATERFNRDYIHYDEDLVHAIITEKDFWKKKSIRKNLLNLIQKSRNFSEENADEIHIYFDDILPDRVNRQRVNNAVFYFLKCLTEEIWHLPELQPIYELQLQKITAEKATEMVNELRNMRQDVQHAMLSLIDILSQKSNLLPANEIKSSLESKKTYHNLPQPDYVRFIGRKEELELLRELLHPDARFWTIVIDGIGGIGKSALALEIARRYLKRSFELAKSEHFDAIVWVSAKATALTADGVLPRHQTIQTLQDIYKAISIILDEDQIISSDLGRQHLLIRRLLTQYRTLLIIDNLETIDDEKVNAFIWDLPSPTKCIITTRHRIDIARPIRLAGMSKIDGEALIREECIQKAVILTEEQVALLFRRTGGVPLAISWSIAQMGYGYSIESVLFNLGNAKGDIARFCFSNSIAKIEGRSSFILLLCLALVSSQSSQSRSQLGQISALSDLDRDEGLVELEKLSLVNRVGEHYSILPLVRDFVIPKTSEVAFDTIYNLLIHLSESYPPEGAYAIEMITPHISEQNINKLKNEVSQILINQMYEWLNYGDDYGPSLCIIPLEKLSTNSSINELRAIISGSLGVAWCSSNIEWAEKEALNALCRNGDFESILTWFIKGMPYSGYIETQDVINSMLQYGNHQNIAIAVKKVILEVDEASQVKLEQIKSGLKI